EDLVGNPRFPLDARAVYLRREEGAETLQKGLGPPRRLRGRAWPRLDEVQTQSAGEQLLAETRSGPRLFPRCFGHLAGLLWRDPLRGPVRRAHGRPPSRCDRHCLFSTLLAVINPVARLPPP